MALSDYTIPRTDIKAGKTVLSVRGLSLDDISFLVSVHKEDVDAIVETFRSKVVGKTDDVSPDTIDAAVRENGDELITAFLQQFPLVAANVISLACDEPEAWKNAQRLPLPVQVEALLSIAKLTFEDAEGFKKFVGNVIAVLRSASAQAPQNKKMKGTKSTGSTD